MVFNVICAKVKETDIRSYGKNLGEIKGNMDTVSETSEVVVVKDLTDILLRCGKKVFSVIESIMSEILGHCVICLEYVQEKREN